MKAEKSYVFATNIDVCEKKTFYIKMKIEDIHNKVLGFHIQTLVLLRHDHHKD